MSDAAEVVCNQQVSKAETLLAAVDYKTFAFAVSGQK